MVLLLWGKTKCPLCEKIVQENDKVIAFAAFSVNKADPYLMFSDSVFHKDCFEAHELGDKVIERYTEWYVNTRAEQRKCVVCTQKITNPDDYILINYLAASIDNPISRFNYTHLHKSCISLWNEREDFLILAKKLFQSGKWEGGYLDKLIKEIEKI